MGFRDGELNDEDVIHLIRRCKVSDYDAAIQMQNLDALKLLIEDGHFKVENHFVWIPKFAELLLSVLNPFSQYIGFNSLNEEYYEVVLEAIEASHLVFKVLKINLPDVCYLLFERGGHTIQTDVATDMTDHITEVHQLVDVPEIETELRLQG